MRKTEKDGVGSNKGPSSSSKIFICYRREDVAGYAGRLYDRLAQEFGKGRIFMDIDNIKLSEDFIEVIEKAVASCDVLVAVIGKHWLTAIDAQGRRRLDDPADFVRVELAKALERGIKVFPVLIEGTPMPRADELPPPLQKIARFQACELSNAGWSHEVAELIDAIKEAIREAKKNPFPLPLPWLKWAGLVLAVALVSVGLFSLFSRSDTKEPDIIVSNPTPTPAPTVAPSVGATPTPEATSGPAPAPPSPKPTSSNPQLVAKPKGDKTVKPKPTPGIEKRIGVILDGPQKNSR